MLADTCLTGSCWLVLAGAARCPAVRQGPARPAVLDMAHFPGAAAQSRRRKKLVLLQDVPRNQAINAGMLTLHTDMCAPPSPLTKRHAVSFTCKHAVCSGIATSIVTRPVESPPRQGEKAFLAERAACAKPQSGMMWVRGHRGASSTNKVGTGGPDGPETSKCCL